MKQDHQTSFGRRISAALPKHNISTDDSDLWDKWHLLTQLTLVASEFNLSHRSIGVLRALMSFHPERLISTAHHSAIVFPANTTLSDRLGGMPESTLRRHLSALVSAGIVSRHDSANRKRFARGGRAGQGRIAFGFDLSPLARMGAYLEKSAQEADDRRIRMQALRAELAALRQQVILTSGSCDATDECFRLLRRKPDHEALEAGVETLIGLLRADELSGNDIQNERHIQPESKIISEVKNNHDKIQNHDNPSFEKVVEHFTEYLNFFPEPPRDWRDLSKIAYAIAPMIGIERPVFDDAVLKMRPMKAIATVLYILENMSNIHNPGGYLRTIVRQDQEGRADFSLLFRKSRRIVS